MWFATSGPIRGLSPAMLRYFSSIISSRIILNIRQSANLQRGFGGTGAMGAESSGPVSGLRFANTNDEISAVDTQLRLY